VKKLILVATIFLAVASLFSAQGVAAKGKVTPAADNPNNLYLYPKDPTTWDIIEGGAWGKYNYQISGTGDDTEASGVFNGHGLVAGTDYSLIYYLEVAPNPWPAGGYAVVVIGEGTANNGGNVHITGTATIGYSDTQPDVGDYIGQTGDKIWLVLSSDLEDSVMTAWNPSEYLFEYKLINQGNPESGGGL
jgi:hypothetical protein